MKRVVKTTFPSDPCVTDVTILGQAVRAARTEAGLTIEEAAMTIGIAKQTLSDLEAGKPSVGLGIALKIAHELGVSLFVAPTSERERIRRALRGDAP